MSVGGGLKRFFDVMMSLVLIIAFFPIFVLLVLVIRFKLGAPVLYKQVRPGLNGKPFEMVKFRSMSNTKDADGNALPDEQRLSSFGKFLRSTSLDELPELWNIFRGDMSFVGPRPLLMEYLPLYSPEQLRRHDVRPGITGWAQVNGRNSISWPERFKLDLWYVDNQSVLHDVRILLKTVYKVLSREGISADGQATMQKFTGE